ncbi:hypothetical protein D3C71_1163730 [compost metagenome]
MTRPTTTPMIDNIRNCVVAVLITNWPVSMAIDANLNTVNEAASFTRLSPSNIAIPRLGILTPFRTELAATASGGEIIPPSKKPSAKVNPGIILTEK